jgi:small multidrug resistance pump
MAWLLLAGAIATEVIATATLKMSDGLTRLIPSIVVGVGYVTSIVLLAWAIKLQLQLSIGYAIWSGAGTAAIAVIGMIWLGEPLTAAKAIGIVLIILGAVILNLASAT